MEKIIQEMGKCICGSENIEYFESEDTGDSRGYKFECKDCGKHCIEWYDLTYSETLEI